MQTHEIRRRFLGYFEKTGHTVVPSASLISEDPTLLFTVAGMVPFKPYFLGQATPPFPRATSVQKCVRTAGHRERRRLPAAQHLLPDGRQLLLRRLLQGRRDQARLGAADRFAGRRRLRPGPGPAVGHRLRDRRRRRAAVAEGRRGAARADPAPGDGRQLLVDGRRPARADRARRSTTTAAPSSASRAARSPTRTATWRSGTWSSCRTCAATAPGRKKDDFPILGPLPQQNIDTGLGVERLAFLLQGVENVYETDLLRPIIGRMEALSGLDLRRPSTAADVRMRIIADHSRSSMMLISDGVAPGNEGRGYVLRRLLRRTVRSARLLGVTDPVMPGAHRDRERPDEPVVPGTGDRLRADPAGRGRRRSRRSCAPSRPARSCSTSAAEETKEAGSTVVPGSTAFVLHDTQGFPIDLTLEMAAEAGLTRRHRRVPPADGGAAAAGQGRRQGAQGQARRPERLPAAAGRRPHRVHRLLRTRVRGHRPRA